MGKIFKKVFLGMMLTVFMTAGLLPYVMAGSPAVNEPSAAKAAERAAPSRYLVATYFHNTFRCPTCRKIEAFSAEAINDNFSDELKNGSLVWRVINVDEPENEHYVNDYQLYSKHLIVSEIRAGREVRWKDLKKVWNYVGNKTAFSDYVKTEIADWLQE